MSQRTPSWEDSVPRRIVLCFCYQQFTTIYLHWKHNQVVECSVVFFLTQDIADSKILSLALVTLPTEKENWIVAGTHSGSLWAVNTEDETRRHRLQKMSDSVTCLYCNSLSKQRYTWLLSLLCYVSKMPLNRDVQEVTAVHSWDGFVQTAAYFVHVCTYFCTQCNWKLHSWSQVVVFAYRVEWSSWSSRGY